MDVENFLVDEEAFLLLLLLMLEEDSFLVEAVVFFFFAGGGCDGSRDDGPGVGDIPASVGIVSGLTLIASPAGEGSSPTVGAGDGLGVSCSTFTAGASHASAAASATLPAIGPTPVFSSASEFAVVGYVGVASRDKPRSPGAALARFFGGVRSTSIILDVEAVVTSASGSALTTFSSAACIVSS